MAAAMTPAPAATMPASSSPPAMPPPTQRPRPTMPLVAAMTMPTTSEASSISRLTMIAAASMGSRPLLLHDDGALGAVLVELADELVAARVERPDRDGGGSAAGDHLLDVERVALEFLRRRIAVGDDQLDLLAGRHRNLRRVEAVILDRQRDLVISGKRCAAGDEKSAEQHRQSKTGPHRAHSSRPQG